MVISVIKKYEVYSQWKSMCNVKLFPFWDEALLIIWLRKVVSVSAPVCFPFKAAASHAVFEKLNIHFGNDERTGMNNVDDKFYFTSSILLQVCEPGHKGLLGPTSRPLTLKSTSRR